MNRGSLRLPAMLPNQDRSRSVGWVSLGLNSTYGSRGVHMMPLVGIGRFEGRPCDSDAFSSKITELYVIAVDPYGAATPSTQTSSWVGLCRDRGEIMDQSVSGISQMGGRTLLWTLSATWPVSSVAQLGCPSLPSRHLSGRTGGFCSLPPQGA